MKNNLKYTSLMLIAVIFVLVVSVVMTSIGVAPVAAAKPATKTPTPGGGPTATPAPAASYYVDCSAATNGSGTQASPWNNLAPVNAKTFIAGDSILLKRGATCVGQQLWPKGSGASGSPITLGAYGTGNRPIVDGNNAVPVGVALDDALVKLWDQQYWVIQDLEIANSLQNGLLISGSGAATLNYFRITNVYSHNHGTTDDDWCVSTNAAYPGCLATKVHAWEIAVSVNSLGQVQKFNDVVIDGVTAHDAFRGIEFYSPGWNSASGRSTNLTIRNSTVYNTQNDGIFVGSITNALVENNVAYNIGIQPYGEEHTPNAIWNFGSGNVLFQRNEAYLGHSPDVDGGAFDADYSSTNTTYQYNYGHDNDGYCVSAFGAGGFGADANTNINIRYNVCSYDGRDGTKPFQGDLYVTAWSAGKISNIFFYNNTVYWDPVTPNSPEYAGGFWAIRAFDIWHSGAVTNLNFFNNIIYSARPDLVSVVDYSGSTHMNNNLYWYTGAGSPRFEWGGKTVYIGPHILESQGSTVYTSLSAFQSGTGQDANSIYADPLLNSPTYHGAGMPTTQFTLQTGSPAINAGANLVALGIVPSMGTLDFFGNAIPQGGAYDIGAYESGGAPLPTPTNTTVPPTPTRTNTPVGPTPTNTPAGGANLALGKTTTVSSYNSTSLMGDKAVDGNMTTIWRTKKSSSLPSEWINVNLAGSYTISQVQLEWQGNYATAYTIQVSPNGSTWTTVATLTGQNGGNDTITFSPVSANYVKMDSTAWNNNTERNYLIEFEIYP